MRPIEAREIRDVREEAEEKIEILAESDIGSVSEKLLLVRLPERGRRHLSYEDAEMIAGIRQEVPVTTSIKGPPLDNYRRRCRVLWVVDHDRVALEVALGFGVTIKCQIRLANDGIPDLEQEASADALVELLKEAEFNMREGEAFMVETTKQEGWMSYEGYLYLPDGTEVNRWLIIHGHAKGDV